MIWIYLYENNINPSVSELYKNKLEIEHNLFWSSSQKYIMALHTKYTATSNPHAENNIDLNKNSRNKNKSQM